MRTTRTLILPRPAANALTASVPPTADELRAVFDAPEPLTVGIEEELMLLDWQTLDLAPVAPAVLEATGGDARFKLEPPASQIEIVTPPCRSVPEAIGHLAAGRRDLAAAATGLARCAAAPVHPFAAAEGDLNPGPANDQFLDEYATIARRQLVCALQVHVAVGGADRTLAVYNALRAYLPELAALAANGPFHAGADTGLASVRPTIGKLLPRQGVPPALASWEDYAGALRWGVAAGVLPGGRRWWWELRPHPAFGTLEIRVPDAQATVGETHGVATVAYALVGWLAARHDAGELPPAAPTWRIEENRWAACRHGVEGELADLATGERRPTRDRLHALLDALEPFADAAGLAAARALVERNGAMRLRDAARDGGLQGAVAWLADAFLRGAGAPGTALTESLPG